ncbi:MAG: PRC-barrel domain-containing protein [Chloroflexota bacterium]|nr:PRC-barrel domain-containing protein [Chloroflexota bacterium]
MADQPINPSTTLRTLKEAGETLSDSSQDIRGRDVLAKNGDKIGKVDALLVDDQEAKVRFLRIEAGGFLGIGEKKWLIPVDAITSVDKDHVHVDQSRDKIVGAPVYDPSVVATASNDYYDGLYGYYGYGPYWGSGYRYPRWW